MGQTAIIASNNSFIYDRNQASIIINNLKMELDIAQILTLSIFLFIFSFYYIQLYDNHHGLVVIELLTHDC